MKQLMTFKKFNGTIIDDIGAYVAKWVSEYPFGEVIVGCDSQEHAKYIKYAVTIVMHVFTEAWHPKRIGYGAHVVYAEVIDRSKNTKTDIYSKLMGEAEYTIKAAKLIGDIGRKITIHLDYNSNEDELSNICYAAGLGWVRGEGYEAKGKPDAWASSNSADRIAKGKIS